MAGIHLLAIGHRPPRWLQQAYQDYAKRCGPWQPRLTELPDERRLEMRLRAPSIALDRCGQQLDSEQFAAQLQALTARHELSFLLGGAEGLSASIRQRADACWSLSALTFPHSMARLILIEQIYRARCILSQHPYHRPQGSTQRT